MHARRCGIDAVGVLHAAANVLVEKHRRGGKGEVQGVLAKRMLRLPDADAPSTSFLGN